MDALKKTEMNNKNLNIIFNMMVIDSILRSKSIMAVSDRCKDMPNQVFNHQKIRQRIINGGKISKEKQETLVKALNVSEVYFNGIKRFAIDELEAIANDKNFIDKPFDFQEKIRDVIEPFVEKINNGESVDCNEDVITVVKRILIYRYNKDCKRPPSHLLEIGSIGEIANLTISLKSISKAKIAMLAEENIKELNEYIATLAKQLEIAKAAKVMFEKD